MSSNSVPIAISLHPAFISHLNIPNVVLVPIGEAKDLGFVRRLATK